MEENAGFREGETQLQQIKRDVFLKNAPIACNRGNYGAFFYTIRSDDALQMHSEDCRDERCRKQKAGAMHS